MASYKSGASTFSRAKLHASVASDWGLNWEMVRGAASAIDAKSAGAGTSAVAKPQAVFACVRVNR